jgi:hypothetical protein
MSRTETEDYGFSLCRYQGTTLVVPQSTIKSRALAPGIRRLKIKDDPWASSKDGSVSTTRILRGSRKAKTILYLALRASLRRMEDK